MKTQKGGTLRKLFLFLCLCYFNYAIAQNHLVEWYNTENGLPQNSIKDIVKGPYGFLWLATENGILRFDGKDIIPYDNFKINSLRFGSFEKLNDGKIINRNEYDYNTLVIDQRRVYLKDRTISKNIQFQKENYSVILKLEKYDNKPFTDYERLYLRNKNGTYYFKYNRVLFVQKNGKEKEVKLSPETLKHLNRRWFSIGENLFYIDTFGKKIIEIKDGEIIKTHTQPILTDPNNYIIWNKVNQQLFVLKNNTLFLCTPKENFSLEPLFTDPNFQKFRCTSFFWDAYYKKLYVGTLTNGLFILKQKIFKTVKDSNDETENVFYTSLPNSDSTVICPRGRVFSRNGVLKNHQFIYNDPFLIEYDQEKNIILTKLGSVYKYLKNDDYKSYQFTDFTNKEIMDIIKDKKYNYLALRTFLKNGELIFTAPDDITKTIKRIHFPSVINKLYQENTDHLLVGTINGLYRFNVKTLSIHFLGLKGIQIRDIIKTKEGNIWITTLGRGIFLKQKNTFKPIPADYNKNILTAHTVIEDQQNYLWIPTNNGLYRVEKTQLLSALQGKNKHINYYRFTKKDGFFTNEFNGGGHPSYNILKNGEIVLPSMDGLVFFNPDTIQNIYPQNGFYVERALLDDKEIRLQNNMELSQDFNKLEIFVDVAYFGNQDNLFIQAKYENSSKKNNWEDISNIKKITLAKLDTGNHSITIRVLKSAKGEYYYKTLKLYVKPYFYQTAIFRIVVFFLLIALVYFIIKIREKRFQRANRELEAIVEDKTKELLHTVELLQNTKKDLEKESIQQKRLIGTITHDITTPIKFISMGLGAILDHKKFGEEMNEKIIKSLHQSSSQLYLFSKILKEYSEIYNDSKAYEAVLYPIYNLVEEKKNLFEEIAKNNNTVINNKVPKKLQISINKKILAAILHNLIDNAVKNTPDGVIEISAFKKEENIFLEVKDTGNGISEEKIKYYEWIQEYLEKDKLSLQKFGLGLHLIIQLLQIIDGKLIIEKNTPKGTVFKIKIINE